MKGETPRDSKKEGTKHHGLQCRLCKAFHMPLNMIKLSSALATYLSKSWLDNEHFRQMALWFSKLSVVQCQTKQGTCLPAAQ